MQTKALYMDDSYLKEFDTEVVSIDGKYIILAQTAFFPQGGGVECDKGIIRRYSDSKEFTVLLTKKENGEIVHEVEELGLAVGDKVHCRIDWDRRYLLMRYHTGIHVLCGVFSRDYSLLVTGNQLTVEKARIDLNMEVMDQKIIDEAFVKANEIIRKDLPVEVYYKSRLEAEKDASLFKLAIGFPHEIDTLRIVDIKSFDAQADGGCHIRSLKEVGALKFIELVNKGKNNRRIYFRII